MREVRSVECGFGRTTETTDYDHLLEPVDQIRVADALHSGKCPICGASPRDGVAFIDEEYADGVVYAVCPRCDHAELL